MPRLAPAIAAFAASSSLVAAAWWHAPLVPTAAPDRSPEATAYQQACSRCHPPFDPKTHRSSEWRGVVGAMHQRMSERGGEVAPETLELAIRFLERHGR